MRTANRSLFLSLAAGLLLGPTPAVSQDSVSQIVQKSDADGDGMLQRDETPIELLPRFREIDRDGDGSIDSYEAWEYESRERQRSEEKLRNARQQVDVAPGPTPKAPPRTLVELIERRDRDGDGQLSRGELPESISASFGRLDLDGNGFMDVEEAQKLDSRQRAGPREPTRRTLVRVVGLMDTDGDGVLQKKEAPLPVQRAFEQFDRNGDGAIDLDEARAVDAARINPAVAR